MGIRFFLEVSRAGRTTTFSAAFATVLFAETATVVSAPYCVMQSLKALRKLISHWFKSGVLVLAKSWPKTSQ